MMIEVFKTNVTTQAAAELIINAVNSLGEAIRINFDLDDCDRILRVEGSDIEIEKIIAVVEKAHFECILLE
ncbi:MAG: hypothetical protein EOO89_24345 [Pedobacter sp.]|nr:MAG: hypothetical protein EOO89_24345 [Pedobacter sp.]